jgi:hypothetical protein
MGGWARRVGQRVAGFLAGSVLLPLTMVGTVVVAAVQVVREPFVRRRVFRRYRELAHRLGIDRGTMLRCRLTGGGMATPQLDIVSLWPGSPGDVVPAVIAGVTKAGYTEMTRSAVDPTGYRVSFHAPPGQGLPGLIMVAYGPGETLSGTGQSVPPATTGLLFGLA